jgi:hypothetical protein
MGAAAIPRAALPHLSGRLATKESNMALEYFGHLREGADDNFPLASERIADFRELLSTGLLLNAFEPAEEEPTADEISAVERVAERTAAEIVDALIYGVPPKLAAFLGTGQPPEIVEQINGWLAMVTETSPVEIALEGGTWGMGGGSPPTPTPQPTTSKEHTP